MVLKKHEHQYTHALMLPHYITKITENDTKLQTKLETEQCNPDR